MFFLYLLMCMAAPLLGYFIGNKIDERPWSHAPLAYGTITVAVVFIGILLGEIRAHHLLIGIAATVASGIMCAFLMLRKRGKSPGV